MYWYWYGWSVIAREENSEFYATVSPAVRTAIVY